MRGLLLLTVWLLVALLAVSAVAAYGAAEAAAQAMAALLPAAPAAVPAGAPAAEPASPAAGQGLDHLATYAHLVAHLQARSGWDAERAGRLAAVLVQEGVRQGINPWVLAAVIEVESDFRADAVGASGEIGLMQILPETARLVARSLGVGTFRAGMLFDPAFNVRMGAAHLGRLLRSHQGDVVAALTAYNAGRPSSGVGLRYAYEVLSVLDGVPGDLHVAGGPKLGP